MSKFKFILLLAANLVTTLEANIFETPTRVVGGDPVPVNTYPWFASMEGSYICGASLVAPEFVITAAHCLGGFSLPTSYKIGAFCKTDSKNCGQYYEEIDVQDFYFHPNYTDSFDGFDLALVRLSEPSTITPVALDHGELAKNYSDSKDNLWTIGFGTLFYEGPTSPSLMHVELDYIPNKVCNDQYSSLEENLINESMLCAGRENKDACHGDSGGPLFDETNNAVVGVVSWGHKCAEPGFPGVYASIGSEWNWIKSSICAIHSAPRPAFCPSHPTSAPTPLPTISNLPTIDSSNLCQDSVKKFRNNAGKRKTCKWVGKKEIRCTKQNRAKEHCPVTCKNSCTCFDTGGTIWYKGKKLDCDYVAQDRDSRCNINRFRSHCPITCRLCGTTETDDYDYYDD